MNKKQNGLEQSKNEKSSALHVSMAVENVELMDECYSQHWLMGTAGKKYDK